jgi:hypothetical protein
MYQGSFDYTYPDIVRSWLGDQPPYSKVIFISGPYRDPRGEYYIHQNIQTARAYALAVWRMGGVALCPHLNTMLFGGAEGLTDHVWLQGDLELLNRSDAILMIQGWERSQGSKAEKAFAEDHGIIVLESIEEVAKYLME